MPHAKLVTVKSDMGTAYLQPEHVAFIEPQQGTPGRCVVMLAANLTTSGAGVSAGKIALSESADSVAQKINSALI